MTRFALICALVAVFHADATEAQTSVDVPSVGILTLSSGPHESIIESFRTGLRQLGYVEGQSIRIEHAYAEGHAERLPRLAKRLAQLRVRAIVTGGGPHVRAAVEADPSIPIVAVIHEADPAASGMIESYRHPGSNVTEFDETWGRAAYFVDRILKGAKPSDLPVEQISRLRLVINQRTASALGVSFPQSILLRADETIR